jgi:hypothetical protein
VVANFGRKDLLSSSGDDCTVLIAAPNLQSTLKNRGFPDTGELLTFSDTDALRALEVISRRRPRVVALERLFAATPRGAALINRIKADPTLTRSEIRVVSDDGDRAAADPSPFGERPAPGAAPAALAAAPLKVPLDPIGTRRAPRFTMAPNLDADLNGQTVTVVELSTVGAQVVSPTVLKPSQRVRLTLADQHGAVRCSGLVTFASFEMPPKASPRYRAGIAFLEVDRDAVDAFCARHKA